MCSRGGEGPFFRCEHSLETLPKAFAKAGWVQGRHEGAKGPRVMTSRDQIDAMKAKSPVLRDQQGK